MCVLARRLSLLLFWTAALLVVLCPTFDSELKCAETPRPSLGKLLTKGCVSLSYNQGVRQPAASLFEPVLERLEEQGISPSEILHVAPRLKDELAPAKKLGLRTALYAGDAASLVATSTEVNNPELRPDRILTDLRQIRQIVKQDA